MRSITHVLALAVVLAAVGSVSAAGKPRPLPDRALYSVADGALLAFPTNLFGFAHVDPTGFALPGPDHCDVTVRNLATGVEVHLHPDPQTAQLCADKAKDGDMIEPLTRLGRYGGVWNGPFVAIAGTRVAWVIRYPAGDVDHVVLEVATLSRPVATKVADEMFSTRGTGDL